MRHQDRLGGTEVRVGRHQCVTCGARLGKQGTDCLGGRMLQQWNPSPEIQTEIERDLLVPRTARVKTLPCIAEAFDEQPLHETVNIFVGTVDKRRIRSPTLENGLERGIDGGRLRPRQHAGLLERTGPRQTAAYVVLEEASIETEGGTPFECRLIGGCGKSAGPERCHQRFAIGIITGVGRFTAFRATIKYAPLNSFSRTTPESRSCTDSTNPLRALRSGENHSPL